MEKSLVTGVIGLVVVLAIFLAGFYTASSISGNYLAAPGVYTNKVLGNLKISQSLNVKDSQIRVMGFTTNDEGQDEASVVIQTGVTGSRSTVQVSRGDSLSIVIQGYLISLSVGYTSTGQPVVKVIQVRSGL